MRDDQESQPQLPRRRRPQGERQQGDTVRGRGGRREQSRARRRDRPDPLPAGLDRMWQREIRDAAKDPQPMPVSGLGSPAAMEAWNSAMNAWAETLRGAACDKGAGDQGTRQGRSVAGHGRCCCT